MTVDGRGAIAAVTKRDGRRVPFDPEKIRSAVWRAMCAVGDGDEAFADDVAAVVTLALEREAAMSGGPTWIPDIETIQDRVERALVEMGRAGVAKAYILYRDRRARAREARVASAALDGRHAVDGDSPRVRQADRFAPWSRGRIAAALVNEADLPRDVAERVAATVERRVLDSGLSEVSTALVRALVDHELVALGLVDALRHTEPVALPRHDLRRLVTGAGAEVWEPWRRADVVVGGRPWADGLAAPGDLGAAAGGEVLRRFALGEVLDRRSADLHAAGDLHVEDLRRPHRFLHLSVPTELALGVDGEGATGSVARTAAELSAFTSRGLTFDDAGPLLRAALEERDELDLFVTALTAVGQAAGQRICLRADGRGYAAERAALVVALAGDVRRPFQPLVLMDVEALAHALEDDPRVRDAVLHGLARGQILPSWHRGEGRPAGPGAVRGPGERGLVATAGAVALNLPRLARRSGPWQEERFLEELFGLLSCALEACRALAAFQERSGPRRRASDEALARAPFARSSFALVPVGLPEALRVLGDGELDPEQGARVLGLVAEAAARFPEPGAPRVEPCPLFGAEAARRLAFTDRTAPDAPRAHQAWLFAEMSGQDTLVRSYTPGYAAGPSAAWRAGEAEAELVRTLPSGFLYPPPTPVPGAGGSLSPSVQLERFVALRRSALARVARGRTDGDDLLPLEQGGGAAVRAAARGLRLVSDPALDAAPGTASATIESERTAPTGGGRGEHDQD